jgi:hypothetical protein
MSAQYNNNHMAVGGANNGLSHLAGFDLLE